MCDLACSRRFGWIADSIGLHHLSKKKEHWTCCVGVYKSGPLMSTVYVATTVTIDVYTHYMRAELANR